MCDCSFLYLTLKKGAVTLILLPKGGRYTKAKCNLKLNVRQYKVVFLITERRNEYVNGSRCGNTMGR